MKTRQPLLVAGMALAFLMALCVQGWAQLGNISGVVKDGATAVPSVSVRLFKDNQPTNQGMLTDELGKFEFSMLEPGSYSVKVDYNSQTFVSNVQVASGELNPIEMQLAMNDDENGPSSSNKGVVIVGGAERLFTVDPKQQWTLGPDQVRQQAVTRDITDIIAMVPGMGQKDQGDPLNFRGGRADGNATYIDNMKLRGSDEMPLGAIEQISVITGGLPAEYGDVTGAVIVVTTRNPGMAMGHVGKPLTKAEKQQLRQQRKHGRSGTQLGGEAMDMDMAAL